MQTDKEKTVALLTLMARSLLEAKVTFVIAIDFKDGSGEKEFWSSMYGKPAEREKLLSNLAEISHDMREKE